MRPFNLNFDRATHVSLIQNEKKRTMVNTRDVSSLTNAIDLYT